MNFEIKTSNTPSAVDIAPYPETPGDPVRAMEALAADAIFALLKETAAASEVQQLEGITHAYFVREMGMPTSQYWRETKMFSDEKLQDYAMTLTKTAMKVLDPDVIELSISEKGHSPMDELNSMLMSIDHNTGVYYEDRDVNGIFDVVAREFFADETLQEQLRSRTVRMSAAMKARAESLTSVDKEVALAVIKDESGKWSVVSDEHYSKDGDFTPLEIIRQDNSDKSGSQKYRVRAPKYTRSQDELYDKQVVDGWYTSEWHEDPNYWSDAIRSALRAATANITAQLPDGVSVLLTTEGGVSKGTATANTDIDTRCNIIGSSFDDFEKAAIVAKQTLAGLEATIRFRTRSDAISEVIAAIAYFDRTTGERFYESYMPGEYKLVSIGELKDEVLFDHVVSTEKVLMITTAQGVMTYKKPTAYDGQEVPVAISVATGTVEQVVEAPNIITPPRIEHSYGNSLDVM